MIVIIPLIIAVGVLAWLLRPGKRSTNPRRIAILVTVIPPLIVAIAAVVFQLLHNADGKMWVKMLLSVEIRNVDYLVFLFP